MKVQDVMSRNVRHLSADTTVKEAAELLQKNRVSGLPVMDDNGMLLGMFTEKDILSHILPSYIEKVGSFVYEENPKAAKRKFGQLGEVTVSKLMRREVVTVNENVTLCEVARVMLTQKVRRIPVVDKDYRVVGIVARCDILKGLIEEERKA
ncbi:MAG: CBS domain-containing protein [Candidatus Omnitrophota bacterium]|jgi:CBS domain-containing protein